MCKAMEDMRNEAVLEDRKTIAISLLALGKLSYEEIAKCSKLSLEEVQKLTGTV